MVTDKELHRSHFAVREWETGSIRPLRRYTEHFADIRRIQKYIIGRAAQYDVPVVDNKGLDESVNQVLGTVLERVEEVARRAQTA